MLQINLAWFVHLTDVSNFSIRFDISQRVSRFTLLLDGTIIIGNNIEKYLGSNTISIGFMIVENIFPSFYTQNIRCIPAKWKNNLRMILYLAIFRYCNSRSTLINLDLLNRDNAFCVFPCITFYSQNLYQEN